MLLAACGSSAAHPATSTRSSASAPTPTPTAPAPGPATGCGPAGARTLAADAKARVYATGGQVYGCSRGAQRRFALGGQRSCLGGSLAGPFALMGSRVAYGVERCGVDTGRSLILVRALDTGRVSVDLPATSSRVGVESYVRVTAIVLSPSGSVAWITQAGSIVAHRQLTEVHAARAGGAAGPRVLDAGPGIATRSLSLSGSTVRWRDGGRMRSARLA